MGGLLDFISAPEGQGLLSAAFGGLAGARRGAPLNTFGNAGMAGLLGYNNALDRQQKVQTEEEMRRLRDAQISHLDAQNLKIQQDQDTANQLADIGKTVAESVSGGTEQTVGALFNPAKSPIPFNMTSPDAQNDYVAYAQKLMQRKQSGETLSPVQDEYLNSFLASLEPIKQTINPNAEAVTRNAALSLMTVKPEIAKGYLELSKSLTPREFKPGSFYQDPVSGSREYIGDPTKGIDFKNGSIIPMQGYQNLIDLAAAQEAAKARATEEAKGNNPVERAKTFNETGIDPLQLTRGGTIPNQTDLPPKLKNDIAVRGAEAIAGKQGDILDASRSAAAGAVDRVQSVNSIRDALASNNAFSGPLAMKRLSMAQLADVMGISGKDTQERIVNTRAIINGLANMSLDAASKLKGQGQVTESERQLLERAASGNIGELTLPEIRQILDLTEQQAKRLYDNHGSMVERAKAQGINTWAFEVPAMPVYAHPLPSNPKAADLKKGTVYQTAKGKLRWNGIQFEDIQ